MNSKPEEKREPRSPRHIVVLFLISEQSQICIIALLSKDFFHNILEKQTRYKLERNVIRRVVLPYSRMVQMGSSCKIAKYI